jgi:hypothetical protein
MAQGSLGPIKLTILGARQYTTRASHNEQTWKKLMEKMKYDPQTHTLAADLHEVQAAGVPRSFINYAIRNDFLHVIH